MRGLPRIVPFVLLLAACSTYDRRFHFEPAPHGTTIARKADDTTEARVLASVVGVRNSDSDEGRPREIEARIRVENVGKEPVEFHTDELRLLTADLIEVPASFVDPPVVDTIEPGGDATVVAYFPVPGAGGGYDVRTLSGIRIRWRLRIGERPVAGDSQFRMRSDAYYWYGHPHAYGPYWGPWAWHHPYWRRRGVWYW